MLYQLKTWDKNIGFKGEGKGKREDENEEKRRVGSRRKGILILLLLPPKKLKLFPDLAG